MATPIVRVNAAQFDRVQRLLRSIAGGLELAGSRAINDTLRAIRASAVRKIKAKMAVTGKKIRERIILDRATKAIPQGKMIVAAERRIPLFLFGAKQRKKGVSYKIKPGEKRKVVPGAFIHEGRPYVFVREFADAAPGAGGSVSEDFAGRKRVARRPIGPVFGPSIGRIFEDEVQPTIEAEAAKKLEERLEFHTDDLLRKAGF